MERIEFHCGLPGRNDVLRSNPESTNEYRAPWCECVNGDRHSPLASRVDNSVASHFHLSSVDDCSRMVQTCTAEELIQKVDSVVSPSHSCILFEWMGQFPLACVPTCQEVLESLTNISKVCML
jgi:hypothetical protein